MHLVMANNYTSITVVADRLLRHPMMAGISFEAILDYTIDFIRIVQCQGFFEEKCVLVDIEDYRGVLPQDFYEMYQVRLAKWTQKVPKYIENTITTEDGTVVPIGTYTQAEDENGNPIFEDASMTLNNNEFTYSTDSFHMSNDKYSFNLTYKIQGGIIYTSIKDGQIEISYQAIMLDEEGYPVIPDNSKFLRALEAYIKKQWFTILFDMGKLQAPILQNVQQEYAWAVGACESEFQKLSIDKAKSLYNDWSSWFQNPRKRFDFRGGASSTPSVDMKRRVAQLERKMNDITYEE